MIACILPGTSPDDLAAALRRAAGDGVEIDNLHPGEVIPEQADMGLFDSLCEILQECDPQGVPVPLLLTTPTDARHFDRMGIQTYGFQPMNLPPEINLAQLAHAHDERIPVEAVAFGVEAMYQALHRFGGG